MNHPFDGIEAKIVRAGEHLRTIGEECQAFLRDKSIMSFEGAYEADRRAWVERVRVHKAPPLRLGALVGDFIHNLRCALDHLAYALTELDDGDPEQLDQSQFPICSSKRAFDNAARRRLSALTPEHISLIERVQPFSGRQGVDAHPLTWLRELSNADKHHVVQGTYVHLGDQRRKPLRYLDAAQGPSPLKRILIAPSGTRLEDGAELVVLELADDAEIPMRFEVGGNFHVDVAFGDRALGWEHLPTLQWAVRTIVTRFIPEFPTWA